MVSINPAIIADNVKGYVSMKCVVVNPLLLLPQVMLNLQPHNNVGIHRTCIRFTTNHTLMSSMTKITPLEQAIREPSSNQFLTRNQLRSDGDMCMYALTVSTVEPKNVKEAMTDPAWIESMQE
ncbi:hypothetical protein Tco_1044510 [Tanacetum coccineum]|uniref:Gag-Pol polyprotein n=1 Tax=Tanacetum coccineum TaxID=301880 RepID=A0ABQ5GQV0_9ASTR